MNTEDNKTGIDEYTIKHPYPKGLSKSNEVEIKSDNLWYVEAAPMFGCQVTNSKNREKIEKKCKQIADLIRDVDELNKLESVTNID